jgi:hypothetical protein
MLLRIESRVGADFPEEAIASWFWPPSLQVGQASSWTGDAHVVPSTERQAAPRLVVDATVSTFAPPLATWTAPIKVRSIWRWRARTSTLPATLMPMPSSSPRRFVTQ